MSTNSAIQAVVLWALRWIERYRYIKFILVGASGLVINLAVVYLGHQYLFNNIEAEYNRPYISSALAIFLSTINNFTWNRLWTWSDRVKTFEADQDLGNVRLRVLAVEFRQYATATAFGSALQYVLVQLLSGTIDYRLATIFAIVAASVSNFLANDRWTFRRR